MTEASEANEFLNADLVERAALLLRHAFRDPREGVSRVNVALALANELQPGASGVLGGSSNPDPEILRQVSTAWQLLEQSRMICRDLTQPTGDWWVLTDLGARVRDSNATADEISMRLGNL